MKVCSENEHVKEERGAGGGAGREGGKTPRLPPQRAAALSRGCQRLFSGGGSLSPGAVRHRAGPTGRGRLRDPCGAARPRGFPSALAPLPHALANDYISQHFPLPSGLCGEPRRLSPSPRLAGGSARRRGGARQPRPRSPPGRAGAEPAALGASGAAGSAMRAAACLLCLALGALTAAPGERRGRRGWGDAAPRLLRSPMETEPPLQPARRGRGRSRVTVPPLPCAGGAGPAAAAAAAGRRGQSPFAERQSIRPLRLVSGEGGGGARWPALSTRVRSEAARAQVRAGLGERGRAPAAGPGCGGSLRQPPPRGSAPPGDGQRSARSGARPDRGSVSRRSSGNASPVRGLPN